MCLISIIFLLKFANIYSNNRTCFRVTSRNAGNLESHKASDRGVTYDPNLWPVTLWDPGDDRVLKVKVIIDVVEHGNWQV